MSDPAALLDLARSFRAASLSKARYWRDWKRVHSPADAIRVADELRRQVLLARPGWPSARDRRADLATHLRVIAALDRVPSRRR
jgi:hypothetical protein